MHFRLDCPSAMCVCVCIVFSQFRILEKYYAGRGKRGGGGIVQLWSQDDYCVSET